MDSSPWRLSAGAGAALVAVVALVAWRSSDLAGGWLWALRIAALVAVIGLLAVVLLAGLQGLRPPHRREVVVEVPPEGVSAARVVPVPGAPDLAALRRLLVAAVTAAAPVLVVLVLAVPASSRLAVAGGEVATASPSATTSPAPPSASPSASALPGPSPAPSASASASASLSASPSPSASTDQPCRHVVTSGQTLWGIAAAQLGRGASDAEIDRRWRAVYAANLGSVGPDPDLIRPGLVLLTCL